MLTVGWHGFVIVWGESLEYPLPPSLPPSLPPYIDNGATLQTAIYYRDTAPQAQPVLLRNLFSSQAAAQKKRWEWRRFPPAGILGPTTSFLFPSLSFISFSRSAHKSKMWQNLARYFVIFLSGVLPLSRLAPAPAPAGFYNEIQTGQDWPRQRQLWAGLGWTDVLRWWWIILSYCRNT